MSGNGAFEEDMGHEVDNFMLALLAVVPAQPPARIEADLIPRLAETARRSGRTSAQAEPSAPARRHGGWGRLAIPARVVVAATLVVALTASLAIAGVKLPKPARSAFESIGISLPNQSQPSSSSEAAPKGAPEGSGEGQGGTGATPGQKARGRAGHGSPRGKGQSGPNPSTKAPRHGASHGGQASPGSHGHAPKLQTPEKAKPHPPKPAHRQSRRIRPSRR